MPETLGVPLLASAALIDRGPGFGFDLLWRGQTQRAFVLRYAGQVVGYLNRCAHVPAELDWTPGDFLDADRALIVCSLHGAAYAPLSGQCVGGPCGRNGLVPVPVGEALGQVYWYPSADFSPLPPTVSA